MGHEQSNQWASDAQGEIYDAIFEAGLSRDDMTKIMGLVERVYEHGIAAGRDLEQERNKELSVRYQRLWDAYMLACKERNRLGSVASDIYDLYFEEDDAPELRRLRRIMKVCNIFFMRK